MPGFPPGSLRPAHCVRLVLLEFARSGNRHCAGGSFCNICYEICQLRCVQLPAECALLQAMHEALLSCVSFCPLRCFAALRCCAWQNCRNAKREQPAAVFLQFTRCGNCTSQEVAFAIFTVLMHISLASRQLPLRRCFASLRGALFGTAAALVICI